MKEWEKWGYSVVAWGCPIKLWAQDSPGSFRRVDLPCQKLAWISPCLLVGFSVKFEGGGLWLPCKSWEEFFGFSFFPYSAHLFMEMLTFWTHVKINTNKLWFLLMNTHGKRMYRNILSLILLNFSNDFFNISWTQNNHRKIPYTNFNCKQTLLLVNEMEI